jgi:hypothetical protein
VIKIKKFIYVIFGIVSARPGATSLVVAAKTKKPLFENKQPKRLLIGLGQGFRFSIFEFP